jgi:hypothetical protein
VPANRAHQSWMLDRILEMISSGTKDVKQGELLETDFLKAVNIIYDRNKIVPIYTFTEFHHSLFK